MATKKQKAAKASQAASLRDTLQDNLRFLLFHRKTSWQVLAKAAGLNPATVRGWVRGGNPSLVTLERIGDLVGVSPHLLLTPGFDPRSLDGEPVSG